MFKSCTLDVKITIAFGLVLFDSLLSQIYVNATTFNGDKVVNYNSNSHQSNSESHSTEIETIAKFAEAVVFTIIAIIFSHLWFLDKAKEFERETKLFDNDLYLFTREKENNIEQQNHKTSHYIKNLSLFEQALKSHQHLTPSQKIRLYNRYRNGRHRKLSLSNSSLERIEESEDEKLEEEVAESEPEDQARDSPKQQLTNQSEIAEKEENNEVSSLGTKKLVNNVISSNKSTTAFSRSNHFSDEFSSNFSPSLSTSASKSQKVSSEKSEDQLISKVDMSSNKNATEKPKNGHQSRNWVLTPTGTESSMKRNSMGSEHFESTLEPFADVSWQRKVVFDDFSKTPDSQLNNPVETNILNNKKESIISVKNQNNLNVTSILTNNSYKNTNPSVLNKTNTQTDSSTLVTSSNFNTDPLSKPSGSSTSKVVENITKPSINQTPTYPVREFKKPYIQQPVPEINSFNPDMNNSHNASMMSLNDTKTSFSGLKKTEISIQNELSEEDKRRTSVAEAYPYIKSDASDKLVIGITKDEDARERMATYNALKDLKNIEEEFEVQSSSLNGNMRSARSFNAFSSSNSLLPPMTSLDGMSSVASVDEVDIKGLTRQELKNHKDITFRKNSDDNFSVSTREMLDEISDVVVMIRCRYKFCGKIREMKEAKLYYKMCHNCFTYYCSKECREKHWERHKIKCVYSRVNSVCKAVLSALRCIERFLITLSDFAETQYFIEGKGVVLVKFESLTDAENFARGHSNELPSLEYVTCSRLSQYSKQYFIDILADITESADSYDPVTKMIVVVAINILPFKETNKKVIPRIDADYLTKFLRVRVASVDDVPHVKKKGTLLATSAVKQENFDSEKQRSLFFTNLQSNLKIQGVNLRVDFPFVYKQLCTYVETGEHFSPITICPHNPETGKQFLCLIMPDSEPNFLGWVNEETHQPNHLSTHSGGGLNDTIVSTADIQQDFI